MQIRAFASIEVNEESQVTKKLCQLLYNCPFSHLHFVHEEIFENTKLSTFSREQICGVLKYYGLPPGDCVEDLQREGRVKDLKELIVRSKRLGMHAEEYWQAMIKCLQGFLEQNNGMLTEKQSQILKEYLKMTQQCELVGANYKTLLYYQHYLLETTGDPEYQEALDLLMDQLVNLFVSGALKSKGKKVGELIEGGWNGHFVQVELCQEEDHYIMRVANAGNGAGTYHYTPYSWWPPAQLNVVTINTYQVPNEESLREVLRSMLYADLNDDTSGEAGMAAFYESFSNLERVINTEIPARPKQIVGNCGFRNQEEMFFYALQREGEEGLANRFQDYLIEFYQNHPNRYPALKDAIEEQKKAIASGNAKCSIKALIRQVTML